ncbi:GMC oxidoreductase [Leucosporidium creatinivorum]|uniref:GMC oxidoreductase n=1 Tax=Leucosporidium creatinivorum TaxID=106004 RepID=A0A1Y2DA47_9BASI|nr:GMC oxidoreductase [Leucosporidium creatinivorum]
MSFFAKHAGVSKPHLFCEPAAVGVEPSKRFDYIIAGGGTAGCVLASRLTEDPNVSVLVIEAGESDQKQLMSKIPAGWGNLWKTPAEWDFETVPQEHANGRALYQPRGKMLGGCSAINAACYQHCSPSDYDNWEAMGAQGWGYNSLKPYFRKAELFTPHPDHAIDGQHRGAEGPWQTSYPPSNELTSAFLKAGTAIGIPHNPDLNVETNTTGITRFQCHVDSQGQRSSTSSAYIPSSVASRPNLSILTGTTCTRLLFSSSSSTEEPTCIGVEVAQTRDGPRWIVGAKKEVLLCLGAFGTPQLLLASGVGDKEELEKVGVKSTVQLEGVGKGLRDHVLSTCVWKAKKGSSLQFLTNPVATLPALARWLWDGKGALSTNLAEGGAFLRSDAIPGQESTIAKGSTNASGPTSPDLEVILAPLYYVHHGLEKPPSADDFLTLAPTVLRPYSRGQVTISSGSTFDKPVIDPKYFSDERDLTVLLEGVKLARRIARSAPLSGFLLESVTPPNLDTLDDVEILAHIRATADTIYHPMSTAAIGAREDGGVIDSELKVHGVHGLRVCDASVFPDSVSGHPVAAVVAVAEKFADMLKGQV